MGLFGLYLVACLCVRFGWSGFVRLIVGGWVCLRWFGVAGVGVMF